MHLIIFFSVNILTTRVDQPVKRAKATSKKLNQVGPLRNFLSLYVRAWVPTD